MRTGRRIANPGTKQLAGTYRADRHADIVATAIPPADQPRQPRYMSPEAKAVWDEEYARVVGCGAVEADSSIFARYCEMEAAFRVSIMAGELPKAALLTELRRSAELLGIAGLRSRLARAGGKEAPKSSPFSVRPK